MTKKLYVGNLSPSVTENTLLKMFSHDGRVHRVNLMVQPATGLSRGFAFVKMGRGEAAEQAIERLDGQVVAGQRIHVNEAHAYAKARVYRTDSQPPPAPVRKNRRNGCRTMRRR